MNLALAAEKARLLPEPVFEAMRRLYPILSDLSSMINKRMNCLIIFMVFAFVSEFFIGEWEMLLLGSVLEKLSINRSVWGIIYMILHFGLLFLAGLAWGHIRYDKKIKEKIEEFNRVYALDAEMSLASILYIKEFDPEKFNIFRKEIKIVGTINPRQAH